MAKDRTVSIEKRKLLLAEGADAYWFFIWALREYGVANAQVLDYGGVSELREFLAALVLLDGFEEVESLVVVRDAESDPHAAVQSIAGSLAHAGLPRPGAPFKTMLTSM